jgi:putative N6-adenine-specific DNA methylase
MDLYAVTAPGLEAICLAELSLLGIAGVVEDGGVAWRGGLEQLYRANLASRTASRILARAGQFRARTFAELERHGARLPWTRYLQPGTTASLRVTCRKSRLYHEGAVAERLARVLLDAGVSVVEAKAADTDEAQAAGTAGEAGAADTGEAKTAGTGEAGAAQLLVVRMFRDVCTISVDASGELLHQRGYRQALGRAPLRETIAAAMLLRSGWVGEQPLVDPMCGSGTIAIEAALLARRIPPGLASPGYQARTYAFERWPAFDDVLWARTVQAARARIRPTAAATIVAADRHGGAITATAANAERAGVAVDITLLHQPLSALAPPAGPGHLVTNPPYGVRVGESRELGALYAALGTVARSRLHGWHVSLLSADDRLAAATALPLQELLTTRNGGIPVRLLSARIPPIPEAGGS